MKNNRPLKIMIVEDEAGLRALYKESLPKDWNVEYFDDGRTAANHYNINSNYDLVVTDLKMETKHGEGLIYDIKYINPLQKIIVISGHTGDLNIPESFKVKVFNKPWDIRKITEVLNNWEEDT